MFNIFIDGLCKNCQIKQKYSEIPNIVEFFFFNITFLSHIIKSKI